jgi:hypothetical protein
MEDCMENRAKKLTFDLDTLFHQASAFAHPMEVVRDADLTLNEKRAVEAAPDLRANASGRAVCWDEIMDALRILDGEAVKYGKPLPHYKRVLASKSAGLLRPAALRSRKRDDEGRPLN